MANGYWQAVGGSGGGGAGSFGYMGEVANTTALTGFVTATIGSTANVGASAAAAVLYELTSNDPSIEADWQPLQGLITEDTVTTIELVAGKLPRALQVYVPTTVEVTVTVGATTYPVLIASANPHVIVIADTPGVTAPTSVTIQRTSGTDDTGWFSLVDGGATPGLGYSDVATDAALIAEYPANSAAIDGLPAGTRVYVEDMNCEVRLSGTRNYWLPGKQITGPRFTGSNAHWIGPAGVSTLTSSAQHLRKWIKPVYYRMPGFRNGSISRISIYQTTAATAGAGTDSCALKLYEANPDGSPVVGQAPLFIWDWNAAGSGGAGTLSLVSAGANATRLHADLPGGAVDVPAHFWLAFSHDCATAITAGCISTVIQDFDVGPAELSGSDLANTMTIPRSSHYTLDNSAVAWSIGYSIVWGSWEYGLGGAVPIAVHLKVTA